MGFITLQIPQLGQSDATEEAKIVSDLTALQALLNGGLDVTNLAAASNIAASNLAAAAQQLMFSAGDVKTTARATAPTGWLMCDGAAVSRSTFGSLFAAIGTAYGAGDGSTTFNLPDLRGRTIVAPDNMGTAAGAANRLPNSNRALGQGGGAELHAHGAGSFGTPDHAHGINGDGGHNHTFSGNHLGTRDLAVGLGAGTRTAYVQNITAATVPMDSVGGHSHGGATTGSLSGLGVVGTSATTSGMQPYQVLNYVIKT